MRYQKEREGERALKAVKDMMNVTIPKTFQYWKAMRTTASVFRFIRNSQRSKEDRIEGSLSNREIK